MKLREAYQVLSDYQDSRMGNTSIIIDEFILSQSINLILVSHKKRFDSAQGNQNKRMIGNISERDKIALYEALDTKYGIKQYEIEKRCSLKYRKQRQFICGLYLGSDCSQDEIGKIINRKRSMVSILTKEFVQRKAKDVIFKKEYKEFKELIKNLEF